MPRLSKPRDMRAVRYCKNGGCRESRSVGDLAVSEESGRCETLPSTPAGCCPEGKSCRSVACGDTDSLASRSSLAAGEPAAHQ